jgi:ABC-type lipoprotein release transport system permease subunit
MARGLSLSALGLVVGLVASFPLTRFLSRFPFGVGAVDAATLATVAVCLGLTAATACLVPGLRASSLDPTSSLPVE